MRQLITAVALFSFTVTGYALCKNLQLSARTGPEAAGKKTPVRLTGGEVTDVDPAGGRVTIQARGETHRIEVKDPLAVKRGGQPVGLDGLSPGDRAAVEFVAQGGRKVARTVAVTSEGRHARLP
jgi:hypothetical protein